MSTLSDRLHFIVKNVTSEYRRFKELEVATGVQGDTWKSWFHGRQRPTAEMIETACKTWPEYAFWLTTGIDDFEHGHTRVSTSPVDTGRERTAAKDLFRKQIEFQNWQERHLAEDLGTARHDIEMKYLSEIWRLMQLRADQEIAMEKLEENKDLARYLESRKQNEEF